MFKEMRYALVPTGSKLVHSKRLPWKKLFFTQFILLGVLLFYLPGQSQDLHYTQFQNAPFTISPGLTGAFREDTRITANYRRQWFSVPNINYETFSVATDLKLWPDQLRRNGFFAFGLSINRDQAGTAKLTLLNLGLNGSYTHRLSNHAFLSFGMQGAFNQRKFDISGLSFDRQYLAGGGGYDPALSNDETKFNSTNTFLSLGAGFNFRLQALNEHDLVDDLRHRSKLDIGFGLSHLNRPDQSFENEEPVQLPVRFSSYVLSIIQLGQYNKNLDLVINALAQAQQQYFELVAVAGIKYHLSRRVDAKKALQLSSAIRFGDKPGHYLDALAPVLDFFIDDWQFGLSYDIQLSPFTVSNNRHSGIEFSLRRGFSKIRLPHSRPYNIL